MVCRRARFRGLQYASFNAFLNERTSRPRPHLLVKGFPFSGVSHFPVGSLPQCGRGERGMDIFSDCDTILPGAGNSTSAPGRKSPAGERPLRPAAPPGPSGTPAQGQPRDALMSVDRLPYATVIAFNVPNLRESHAAQLGPELVSLARLTGGRLALDMSKVSDFSCAWINAMITVAKQCEQSGGKLAIMALSPRLESLLRETGLHRQLYIAGSVKEALQRLAASAERASSSGLSRWFNFSRGDAA